jgi:acyl carrier protein
MELKKFIEKFSEQFEETDIELFTPETEFKKIDEWSSLMSLSIIAMADEEYDVQLKGDDIRNAKTIEELFKIIKSRIQ